VALGRREFADDVLDVLSDLAGVRRRDDSFEEATKRIIVGRTVPMVEVMAKRSPVDAKEFYELRLLFGGKSVDAAKQEEEKRPHEIVAKNFTVRSENLRFQVGDDLDMDLSLLGFALCQAQRLSLKTFRSETKHGFGSYSSRFARSLHAVSVQNEMRHIFSCSSYAREAKIKQEKAIIAKFSERNRIQLPPKEKVRGPRPFFGSASAFVFEVEVGLARRTELPSGGGTLAS